MKADKNIVLQKTLGMIEKMPISDYHKAWLTGMANKLIQKTMKE